MTLNDSSTCRSKMHLLPLWLRSFNLRKQTKVRNCRQTNYPLMSTAVPGLYCFFRVFDSNQSNCKWAETMMVSAAGAVDDNYEAGNWHNSRHLFVWWWNKKGWRSLIAPQIMEKLVVLLPDARAMKATFCAAKSGYLKYSDCLILLCLPPHPHPRGPTIIYS